MEGFGYGCSRDETSLLEGPAMLDGFGFADGIFLYQSVVSQDAYKVGSPKIRHLLRLFNFFDRWFVTRLVCFWQWEA